MVAQDIGVFLDNSPRNQPPSSPALIIPVLPFFVFCICPSSIYRNPAALLRTMAGCARRVSFFMSYSPIRFPHPADPGWEECQPSFGFIFLKVSNFDQHSACLLARIDPLQCQKPLPNLNGTMSVPYRKGTHYGRIFSKKKRETD